MVENTKTIEIDAETFEIARRTAALDKVDIPTLVESLVRRHAEYVETLTEITAVRFVEGDFTRSACSIRVSCVFFLVAP